jgi:Subunit ChlI of Mg-chelatase
MSMSKQRGLPNILLIGLPDATVQEAGERVRAAIRNSGLSLRRAGATRVAYSLLDPAAIQILARAVEGLEPTGFRLVTSAVADMERDYRDLESGRTQQ